MSYNERLVPLDEMHTHAARVSFISSEGSVVCAGWIDPTAEKNIPALILFALTQEKPALPLQVWFTGQSNAHISPVSRRMTTTGVIENARTNTDTSSGAEHYVPEDELTVLMHFLLSAFGLGCGLWLWSWGYLCVREIQREKVCLWVTFSGLGSIGGRLITL